MRYCASVAGGTGTLRFSGRASGAIASTKVAESHRPAAGTGNWAASGLLVGPFNVSWIQSIGTLSDLRSTATLPRLNMGRS